MNEECSLSAKLRLSYWAFCAGFRRLVARCPANWSEVGASIHSPESRTSLTGPSRGRRNRPLSRLQLCCLSNTATSQTRPPEIKGDCERRQNLDYSPKPTFFRACSRRSRFCSGSQRGFSRRLESVPALDFPPHTPVVVVKSFRLRSSRFSLS